MFKITVILFTYNQEKFVRESLRSILAQKNTNFELIISDDCSTDSTAKIIEDELSLYHGTIAIQFHQNKVNLGIGGNVDVAVKLSHGDYIRTVAGDDICRNDMIDEFYRLIEKYPDVKGFGSLCQYVDINGNITGGDLDFKEEEKIYFFGNKWSTSFFITGCAALWHRILFEDYTSLGGVLAEDTVLSHRVFLEKSNIVISSKKLIKYRAHFTNINNFISAKDSDKTAIRIKKMKVQISAFNIMISDVIKIFIKNKINIKECNFFLEFLQFKQRLVLFQPFLSTSYLIRVKCFFCLIKYDSFPQILKNLILLVPAFAIRLVKYLTNIK